MKKINKLGFTLIELLAVITILALLSSVVIISISKTRNSSKEKEIIALRQTIISAFDNYRIDNNVSTNIPFPIDDLNFAASLSYSNNTCSHDINNTIKFVIKKDIDLSESLEEVYCVIFTCNGTPVINDYADNATYCN